MNRILSRHIHRMICTKGRLALTLTLTLVALFTTAGVLAKEYSFAGGNVVGAPTSFMTSLMSAPSVVTERFFNAASVIAPAPPTATPTPYPGICSNAPTIACISNTDCPSGGTCRTPTAGGDLLANQKCLAAASGIAGGCTANDVSVAQTTSLRVEDRDPITPGVQGCLQPGDTATVSFVAQFHSTATARYDVGVWTSQNGGSALTGADGTCSVADFPSAPTPPWFNQEASIAQDICGDISSSTDVYSSINNIQVSCVDNNGDGNLDINTCLSWAQTATKKSADACTSPIQATAGTTSKCNCGQLPGIAILVPGKIKVDKVTQDKNGSHVNDPTNFNFTISGPDGDLPDNFQLADASAVHESPALNAATGNGTQYAVTEQSNSAYTTTAVCVSDQSVNGVPRPNQNPFAGNGMVNLHAGETLTCTYTNRRVDLCANVTCPSSTACASYSCDGSDGVCKPTYQPVTTSCTGTSNGGACDGADHCDGAGSCVDVYKGAETICRADAGQCDVAETCTGTSGSCPADSFESSTVSCTGTSNGGVCDGTDHCSGTANTCIDVYKGAETTCREAVNGCDVPEVCSGNSGACTAPDAFASANTNCSFGQSNGGVCDAQDTCSGTSATCVDHYKGAETTCREAVNGCDVPEVCSGNSGACTAPDAFASANTNCSFGVSNGGVCDGQDTCSGTAATCVDHYKGAETTCRPAVNECDVPEACSGNSGACTAPDAFASADTSCSFGASNGGACDAPDHCSGTGATCVDVFDTPPTVTLGLNLLCENGDGPEQGGATPTQLVATVSPSGSYSYYWTGPDGPILNGQGQPLNAAAITPTKPGTYTVVVTDTATNCPNDKAFKLCFTGEQFDVASAATQQPQATASFTVAARSQPTGLRAYLAKLLSVFG